MCAISIGSVTPSWARPRCITRRAGCGHLQQEDPFSDFEVNARGTLNVLEAIRACPNPPPLVFTSTNKAICRLFPRRFAGRRTAASRDPPRFGAGLQRGPAARSSEPVRLLERRSGSICAGLWRSSPFAVVFRMSCIYGPRQLAPRIRVVAHFLRSALERTPITIYGTGRQVEMCCSLMTWSMLFSRPRSTCHQSPVVRSTSAEDRGMP